MITNVNGIMISSVISGLIKYFTNDGVTRSAKRSTYDMIQTAMIIGSTDDE